VLSSYSEHDATNVDHQPTPVDPIATVSRNLGEKGARVGVL